MGNVVDLNARRSERTITNMELMDGSDVRERVFWDRVKNPEVMFRPMPSSEVYVKLSNGQLLFLSGDSVDTEMLIGVLRTVLCLQEGRELSDEVVTTVPKEYISRVVGADEETAYLNRAPVVEVAKNQPDFQEGRCIQTGLKVFRAKKVGYPGGPYFLVAACG